MLLDALALRSVEMDMRILVLVMGVIIVSMFIVFLSYIQYLSARGVRRAGSSSN